MLELVFWFWFTILGTVHCVLMYLILIWVQKLVDAFKLMAHGKSEQRQPTSFEADLPYISQKDSLRVPELPPDTIAPYLKKPPRPAGGFGSSVRSPDGH